MQQALQQLLELLQCEGARKMQMRHGLQHLLEIV
jgi:hypothetical protein